MVALVTIALALCSLDNWHLVPTLSIPSHSNWYLGFGSYYCIPFYIDPCIFQASSIVNAYWNILNMNQLCRNWWIHGTICLVCLQHYCGWRDLYHCIVSILLAFSTVFLVLQHFHISFQCYLFLLKHGSNKMVSI